MAGFIENFADDMKYLFICSCLILIYLGAWTWRTPPEKPIKNPGPIHIQCVSGDYVTREKELLKAISSLQASNHVIIDIKPSIANKTSYTEYNFLIIYRAKD